MSTRTQVVYGALVGLLLTLPQIVAYSLGDALFGLPHVPFDVFAWLTRVLPGPLVTFGIDSMVDLLMLFGFSVAGTAKTAENVMALAMYAGLGTVAGALFAPLAVRIHGKRALAFGGVLGLGLGVLAVVLIASVNVTATAPPAIGALWGLLLSVGWGLALGWSCRRLGSGGPMPEYAAAEDDFDVRELDRRGFLIRLGGASAVITVAGIGAKVVLRLAQRSDQESAARSGTTARPSAPAGEGFTPSSRATQSQTSRPRADSPATPEPVPGTRPEITAVEDHYLIDINPRPPVVDVKAWRLPITGLVDNAIELTLDQIQTQHKPIDRFITLSCISNRVGGDLIGTTKWTGVSLQEILAPVGIQDRATHIEIRSVDGFHESISLELIESDPRIMLAYAWNDEPLTREHGAPLRVWIPDRYGMKQPRWIESIEVTDENRPGYWVERGWDREAIVKTTSVIDTVAEPIIGADGASLVPIGGIAYSGDRQISAVELRVDSGAWQKATLLPPLSNTTWVLWRYDWPFESGEHSFQVRCYEGDGTPQIEKVADNRPSGATGLHSVSEQL